MTELFKNISSSSCDGTESANDNNNTTSENVVPKEDEETVVPFVVKAPRADSKLILRNMEEVLNSVKRKHKQKHKRLKEQKKRAQMEASLAAAGAASAVANTSLSAIGTQSDLNGHDISCELVQDDLVSKSFKRKEKHKHKNALKEKVPLENGISHTKSKHKSKKSPTKTSSSSSLSKTSSESILKHFQKTPKKDDGLEDVGGLDKTKNTVKTNAFEVMMNARNKSIGSNTPGKEPVKSPLAEEISANNAKRKLILQEWAEKKGGAKRKLDEESREAYIEHTLEQRAKRFKQMLVNGSSPKSAPSSLPASQESSKKFEESSKPKPRGRPPKIKKSESVDSVIEIKEDVKALDEETAEFISKLSSPTKKRDSLLAYFPKKDSPSQLAEKMKVERSTKLENGLNEDSDTPKRRSRRSNSTKYTPIVQNSTDNTSTPNSSLGRPKRSCAGKNRYDYDLELSPNKKEDRQSKNSTPVTSSRLSREKKDFKNQEKEIDIIVLDDSSLLETPNKPATSSNEAMPRKLAPLFLKAVPKPSPDPEVLRARQEFLRSGVPEKLRIEQNRLKQFEQSYEDSLELFPKISHICQFSQEEKDTLEKCSLGKSSYTLKPFPDIEDEDKTPPQQTKVVTNKRRSKSKAYNFGLLTNCSNEDFKISLQRKQQNPSTLDFYQLASLENKRNIVKSWKNKFDRFPTYKCYNQMREKYRYFSAVDSEQDTEQYSESLVVTRRTRRSLETQKKLSSESSEEEAKPPPAAPNGEVLFTEKYKPLMFEQVLVNLTPVTQLKEFLSSWAFGNNSTPRNSQTLDDSMDFANDSNSSHANSCNSVVLLGPVSSGKSNAVFALANEMNFNVLEINAGMKRTGKKLIQELQEATQSHQIKKDSKSQKQLLKMSLNGLKGRKSSSVSSPSSNTLSAALTNNNNNNNSQSQDNDLSSDLGQNSRKSLILIEDADIVFDQTDAGFVDAIYTLAASSKRPVILVASNPNCSHLQRLMQQNTIVFNPPNVLNISKYLAVLSLIENCPILLEDLISLHLYNKKDLRKTMHQLQFFIQTGGDRGKYLLNKKDSSKTKKGSQEASSSKSQENQHFFASPTKRRLSEECDSNLNSNLDDNLEKTKVKENQSSQNNNEVVMHRCLFEFYTTNQNEKWRVPFPVDFNLLRINLSDIFQKARYARMTSEEAKLSTAGTSGKAKRTSRSPKKEWINTVTASTAAANALEEAKKSSMKTLCNFYENLSVASFINGHYNTSAEQRDRLLSHLSEDIAHTLVEKSIIVNLEADQCPYNLFENSENRISLTDNLGTMLIRTKRSRYLDFEPSMRSICRSEKLRASLERRSTRFYHYLRSACVNTNTFGTEHFDNSCDIFQEAIAEASSNAAGVTNSIASSQ